VPEFEYPSLRPRSRLLGLADAARLADILRAGGLAVLPTETGYLLAALATSERAVLDAFAVKQRDLANTMHIACASLTMATEYALLAPAAARILGEFTPGPVTVVANQAGRLPDRLVTRDGTVGIRVPDHPATLQVIAAVGAPLTASSLNLAGEPPLPVDRETLAGLYWPEPGPVYVVRDDAAIGYEQPSTLVRVTGPEPEILRPGPVSEDAIREIMRGTAESRH
jgi:L-threonylcarbamoyladenylate synthase